MAKFDYQIGVITTDTSTLQVSLADPSPFTNSLNEFENRILVGTQGSGLERGIFFAEAALQNQALGDSQDGTVTIAGYPRRASQMHVIVLSDEPNSYSTFHVNDNLFTQRQYLFHSIVNFANPGDYLNLAQTTNGISADINVLNGYSAALESIVDMVILLNRRFTLPHVPKPGSPTITLNGQNIYDYSLDNNAVVLGAGLNLNPGDVISISYQANYG